MFSPTNKTLYIYYILSIQIGLHGLLKNEKIPTLNNVFLRGCNIKEFINCDRSKLLALLKWLLNCILDTCYFNLKYLLKNIYNETI